MGMPSEETISSPLNKITDLGEGNLHKSSHHANRLTIEITS